MKNVIVVLEAGNALTGIVKGKFIYTFKEEKVISVSASSKNEAVQAMIAQCKPEGRTIRVFDGNREIFTNSDF